jgi:transposase-like protein
MGLSRRTFTREFKLSAIRRVEMGVPIAELARTIEVNLNTLHRWQRERLEGPGTAFPGRGKVRWREGRIAEPQSSQLRSHSRPSITGKFQWDSLHNIAHIHVRFRPPARPGSTCVLMVTGQPQTNLTGTTIEAITNKSDTLVEYSSTTDTLLGKGGQYDVDSADRSINDITMTVTGHTFLDTTINPLKPGNANDLMTTVVTNTGTCTFRYGDNIQQQLANHNESQWRNDL